MPSQSMISDSPDLLMAQVRIFRGFLRHAERQRGRFVARHARFPDSYTTRRLFSSTPSRDHVSDIREIVISGENTASRPRFYSKKDP